MSLSLKQNKAGFPIAYYLKNNNISQNIYHIDEDNIDEKDKNKTLKKIKVNSPNDMFFPIINDYRKNEQVDSLFVCGPTGCGKSSFIRDYCIMFNNKFPNAKIYLFSSKREDEVLDKLGYIQRVEIDDDILHNPYTLQQISELSEPSLCVFDDIEDFSNKKINTEIARLSNEILRNGRSYKIYLITVNHQPADYLKTRNTLFEASAVVIFPRRCAKTTYNYLLEKKLHIPKNYIDIIMNCKSNFVYIKKRVPELIISDKYILLL